MKNAQSQPMKYMFEMTLHAVQLHVPYDVQVIVVLKRGSRRLETQKVVSIGSGQPLASFCDEKLTMMTTVYKHKDSRKLQDRIVSLSLCKLIRFLCLNRET